jgi:hypothetical protein
MNGDLLSYNNVDKSVKENSSMKSKRSVLSPLKSQLFLTTTPNSLDPHHDGHEPPSAAPAARRAAAPSNR